MWNTLRSRAVPWVGVALTGCAGYSGIAPRAHEVDTQALDAGAAVRAVEADAAWPKQLWWQDYGDPQLNRLVEQTLAGNPTLRIARARIEQAQGLSDIAHAGTVPSLRGMAESKRTYLTKQEISPLYSQDHSWWDNTILLQATYELDVWGKNSGSVESALDRVRAREVEMRAAQLTLVTSVVQAYVQLSAQYAQRDVAQANLERQQRILDIARSLHSSGIGTQLEVNEAATALPDSESQIERIEETIELERNQLAALSGQGPGRGDGIARPALALDRALQVPASLPAGLVGHRPDIVAQRWLIQAAAKDIDVAKARFYPDINIAALAGVETFGFTQILSSNSFTGGVGPALSLPIFEGGRLRGNLRSQTASYDIAVESYNGLVIDALRDVADQVVSLRSLTRQLDRTDAALAVARIANDEAEQGFRAGLSNYLNVLTTQSELLVQQRNHAQLVARQLHVFCGLMKALGGGFTEDAPTQVPTPASGRITR